MAPMISDLCTAVNSGGEVSGQRGVVSAPLNTFWASLSSCLCSGLEGSRGLMALSASRGKASICCTRPMAPYFFHLQQLNTRCAKALCSKLSLH